MKEGKGFGQHHSISGLFVFGLVGVFALLSLFLVVIGTQAYRNVVQIADSNNQTQSVLSYVANKVRFGDTAGAVTVNEIDGVSILTLQQAFDDEMFETRIYFYDQGLMEQFVPAEEHFFPEDGELLIQVSTCTISKDADSLIKISLTLDSGETRTMHIALRSSTLRSSALRSSGREENAYAK